MVLFDNIDNDIWSFIHWYSSMILKQVNDASNNKFTYTLGTAHHILIELSQC